MSRKSLEQLSPRYRARIERAMSRGKSRQEARGHRPGEARRRREREREESGLSSGEIATIRRWYKNKYNPTNQDGKPDLETVEEEFRTEGYDAFKRWQSVWNRTRRKYLAERKARTYASRGLQYLKELASEAGVPEPAWLYYH